MRIQIPGRAKRRGQQPVVATLPRFLNVDDLSAIFSEPSPLSDVFHGKHAEPAMRDGRWADFERGQDEQSRLPAADRALRVCGVRMGAVSKSNPAQAHA